jgi:general secretion pathway protein D
MNTMDRMKTNNLPTKILALLMQVAVFASPLSTLAQQQTESRPSLPGAGSSATRGLAQTSGTQDLSVGSYVELDESIRNDMYGTIEFPNAQLKDIVLAISKLASKNFILDRKLENRQVTIISPEPVTKQEAYYAFLSALNMNGLTVVSVGKFLKIIEIKSAIQANTRVFVGDYAPPSEEIVTVLYTLKHLNAEDIERFVTEMVPRTGRVTAYPDTNTLVMTDTGINLRRVMSVLKSIDSPGYQEQLENIPIRYGSAKGIAQLIQEILDAQAPGGRRVARPGSRNVQKTRGGGIISKIVPDERTNSLVVLANGRGIRELKDLISKLDTAGASGNGNIHIYYCKNAIAEELAATITSLLSGTRQQNTAGANPTGGANVPPRPTFPGAANAAQSRGGDNISLSGDLKVTADKATNSLVVVASSSDYASLKSILQKLDIPRRQVYVEATIMELTNTDKNQFGVLVNVAQDGVASAFGSAPSNIFTGAEILNPSILNGIIGGISVGRPVRVINRGPTGQEVSSFNVSTVMGLIKAIDESAMGQILHQPQILTSDNQEAEIKVTEQVPVPKTTTSLVDGSSSSGVTSQITFDKENIDISLKITPQIGEGNDLVKLKVDQNIDDFVVAPGTSGQIQKTKRTANTTVAVRSGDTIAIGGLQKISSNNTRSRYPLLGDLPIIGWLFKGSDSTERRSNLVLFLTPHIIESYSDLINITQGAIEDRLELSKGLRDPRDSHVKRVEELKKKNKEDAKKAPPSSWSFRATEPDSASTRGNQRVSPIEADEEFQSPIYDDPAPKSSAYIHFDRPAAPPPAVQTQNNEGLESLESPPPSALIDNTSPIEEDTTL